MLRRILLRIVLVSVLVPTVGCGTEQVKITTAENGKTIDVKTGARIVVELEGNPSTGFTWEPADLDTSMLQQIGEIRFKSGNPGLVGAGGMLTLTYKILKVGTTTLTLVYHRPWETNVEPQSTFIVTLNNK
jgi:inhibitor of cysteine peptidase